MKFGSALLKIVLLVMILGLMSCVSSIATYHNSNSKPQIWTGTISGMFAGNVKIEAWEMEDSAGHQKIENKVIIKNFQSSDGHSGRIQGVLSGFITDGKYEGVFTGDALAIEGDSSLRGVFIGEFSDTIGKGIYRIYANRTSTTYIGKWTLQNQQH